MMKPAAFHISLFLFSIACGFVLLSSGCQMGYLVGSAYSQADLLRRRVPIEEALRDSKISEEHKRKLELVQAARAFAENTIGLAITGNYKTFVQLDRPYVTYVVSAAAKNELEHHYWNYPIVGSLPYKGFFDPDSANAEARSLSSQGFDVFVRGVSAYSTLGWFKDPILSSMLDYRDYDLVNTIIHETTHATVFVKSEADFNESLASFFGNKGTVAFYEQREGKNSPTIAVIHKDAHDETVFGEFISKELDELDKWYKERKGQTIAEDVRKARLKEIQTRFVEIVRPKLQLADSYKSFEKAELNNARLLTYRLYMKDLDDFEVMFQKLGSDFRRMLKFCKTLESESDPKGALARAAHGSN